MILSSTVLALLAHFAAALSPDISRQARAVQNSLPCIPDVTLPKSCTNRGPQVSPVGQSVSSGITYILYNPRNGEAQEINIDIPSTYNNSIFDVNLETKIIIHGYFSSAKNFEHMASAFLTAGHYNVVLMDWSPFSKWCYCEHVIKIISDLGHELGRMLTMLATIVDLKRIHIIGHSLGSHIAGIGSDGRVGRITALDPARPGFSDPSHTDRINKNSARFVDVIHTSAATFGIAENIGHIDFYPNGGKAPQPGCTGVAAEMCSHSRAHYLYAESIITDVGYKGTKCSDWKSFLNGSCNSYNSPTTNMGERLNLTSPHGVYYLKTGAACPYFVIGANSSQILRINILSKNGILQLIAAAVLYCHISGIFFS